MQVCVCALDVASHSCLFLGSVSQQFSHGKDHNRPDRQPSLQRREQVWRCTWNLKLFGKVHKGYYFCCQHFYIHSCISPPSIIPSRHPFSNIYFAAGPHFHQNLTSTVDAFILEKCIQKRIVKRSSKINKLKLWQKWGINRWPDCFWTGFSSAYAFKGGSRK